MVNLMSDTLKEALWQQLVHEKLNANIYLFVAGFLRNKGLDKLGQMFLDQHEEETKHSIQIFDILTDLSTPVSIGDIGVADFQINSILDIASRFLEREILTTESLNEIKQLAIEENNGVVEEAIRHMVDQQRAEYEEATTFMDKATLTGGDWQWVFMWNNTL